MPRPVIGSSRLNNVDSPTVSPRGFAMVSKSAASFNFPATFQNLLQEVGVGRIMFSVDYPYGSMAEARAFLAQLPVSDADKERIAHGNAEQLFRF